MKKSKLFSRLLRGSSGGSTKGPSGGGPPELGEAGVAPNPVVAARSSSGRRRETVSVSAPTSTTTARDPSLFHQQSGQAPPRAGVERSSSWKYTHDHTPDSFSINSSPSILDGRSGTGSHRGADEGQTIEKSQSWSGDRLLDCATDSGSSRGGTNNSSRAGSGSRAGSRTGTSSRSSRERGVMGGPPSLPASSRAGSRAGSATASRAGSDRGDSTPSSVYDHPVDNSRGVSQTDADGYENVELPSPQRDRDSGDSSSDQGSSHQHGSRLSVKSSGRRSRRPSPRRQGILTKSQQESTESRGTRGSVRGTVPSISLSTSSPVPPPKASVSRSPSRKSRRSPSRSPNRPPSRSPSRSDSRRRDSQKTSSRSPSRAPSRSPSRGPGGSPVRALSRSPSRLQSRASSGIDPWTRMPGVQEPAQIQINGEAHLGAGTRSMSYEEGRMGARSPGPPPLWKARSWQQYSINNSTPQSERARQLAKSRSWQQQHGSSIGPGQSVDIVLNRSRQHHITRQEALQPTPTAAMGKSRSWQQSHEAEPLPGPLPRTYTVSEKRGRRSSVRLAPPSPTRPSPPSYSHSPARSPLAALPPQSHPSVTTHASIHDSRHIHHPPMRSQASIGGYGAPPSASHTPHLTDYVELRNYEAMERQQQQQQEYVDLRQYRADQVRPPRDPHWRERFYPPAAFTHLKQLQQQQLQQQLQHQQFQQQLQQQAIRLKQQRQLQHQKSMMQQGGYDSQYGSPQRMDGEYASLQEVRDGMVRSDSVRETIIQNGAIREGILRNGSVRNGVVREGSMRDTFVREGSVRGDSSTVRYRPPPLSKPSQSGSSHGKPVKSSSLMTSQELLNTLKRQLALSSPTHTSRSKSLEAGRAAMAVLGTEGEREEEGKRAVVGEEGGEAGRLSPALMALVAEKRARLKRSTGAFTGSGGGRVPVLRQFTAPPARCSLAGLTSDSECDDKKSSASSTGGDRPFPSASPQPQGAVVSTHDYNMEQSNVALLKAELKIVTTDRDIMKKELKKVTRERDEALKGLTAHQQDQPANYAFPFPGTLTKHSSSSDKSLSMSRDYESLKMQCEKAMAEVQGLLKQNVDITRKYENTLKEVDYYKKQERAAYTALQNLRMQYEEVVAEKQKLEREVTSLQTIMEDDRKEIADLRRQQQETVIEAMSQEGSGEAINQLYMTTMRKYEAIKDEYDSIRKRYSDLVASHSNNISKLELTQEEVSRLKKQYEEILRECNEAVREKNCLKQQCTKAITEWDSALREKNKLQEELLKIREKYDEMMKEMNTHLMQRQHLNKDLKRLQEERNAAMQEYTLVMSERDTVHKEMDKLQEELTQASKKIKTIEQTTNDSSKERESLLLQIEMLKREIAASLHDRDKAIKECNDLRERFGAKEDTNKEWERSYKDYDYKQEREMTMKEGGPNLGSSSHDMFSKAQKERLDNLDQANQEIDRLRKTIEKLQNELQEAQQEAEVSKRRRDWAFNERDKIVQERESIRAHCDKLRRERDRAVSELAEALRDSDDMKKQRNEASKELKELKERLEAEQEKAAVVRQLAAHNHSRDSAIDTDMQEWEIETLHMPIAIESERDVGFTVVGGRDDPHYGGSDGAIYVTNITKDGPFEGKLRLHDQIVRLNGLECQGMERASVYEAVMGGGGWIQMTVRRRRSGGRLATAHLHCPHTAHHGLTLRTGVYIANILPGSPAAREGNLAVGDRVLNINGKPVDNIGSCEEAQCLLDAAGEVVQLTTLKSHGSSSLSAPLSSSSSGHNITEDDKSTSSSRPYSSPTSPSKDSGVCSGRSGSRELANKKLMIGSGGGCHSEEGTGGKRYGSSEKVVYNVNKATGENRSKPLDLFMNMVRPNRHSKERGDCHSETRDKEDKKKLDHEAERAIADLDIVNNSYHHKSGSNGGTSTTKRTKKRDKDKSGGTWPKYRGGGLSSYDANSGTTLYTQRRSRPPLSVFLPSPNPLSYPHEEKPYDPYIHEKHLGSRSSSSPHSTPTSPRNQQLPLYKSLDVGPKSSSYSSTGQVYSSQQSSSGMYPSQEVYSSTGPRNPSLDRKSEESERERGDRLSSLTPSDTSLDFSVRSGNVGKEELEYYSKKNILKYTQSDSESNMSPVDPNPPQSLSLPPGYGTRPSLHHGGERIPSHSRIPHPHAGLYSPPNPVRSPPSFAPYTPVSHISLTHTHAYPHSNMGSSSLAVSPRYSSPPTISQGHFLQSSRSGDSILSSPGLERDLRERAYYENRQASSPTPVGMMGTLGSGGFYHSPSPSLEVPGHHKPRALQHLHPYRPPSDEPSPLPIHSGPPSYHDYQRSMGTMPRKKENERIRIPSNTSVASKSSCGKGGNIERSSERGSPTSPNYGSDILGTGSGAGRGPQHVTQITHSVHSPHYQEYSWQRNRPQPGDVRNIYIEKSSEPLGIQIRCLEVGGVYVSSVTVNSLASQVGLCVGDQLLEVCGINMRSATKQSASTVLSQCGTSVTMLVQYNPDKYHEAEGWEGSSSGSSVGGSRSGTPTPRNSPKASSHDASHPVDDDDDDDLPPSTTSTLRGPLDMRDTLEHSHDHSLPPSARSTLTRPEIAHVMNSLKRQETFSRRSESAVGSGGSVGGVNSSSGAGGASGSIGNTSDDARLVYLELNKSHNLGIQMVGGNALGIFVHSVPADSPAAKAGLRPGDQILEYNKVDLRHATAEQAALELAKPADNVTMLVRYDYQRYEEIQDKPGDSFYIRALFDRLGDGGDSTELRFRKDDILYVDDTMFNHVRGLWHAWIVDEDGHKRQRGTVPSKDKVEEEMRLHRSSGDLQMDSSRRGSTSTRRSFFKRKKHFRSSSRELASFIDSSLTFTEAAPMHEEPSLSYIRVERLDYLVRRPVVMVGPLWELVCDKLVHDYSLKFTKCVPEISRCSIEEMEEAVQNNIVVDYRRRGSHFEVTTVNQVKEICDKNYHGILDISLSSVERLHQHNIYPIVLLLKYRHHKQIREVCDSHHPSAERISQKEAKEMYELSIKIEQEYKHVISAVIPAAVNMPYISTQVKSHVDQEQSKTLWVPSGSL
ncbi:disks large homolog 5 isoform X2 [Macrobrachium rosenbergii]|uniref:disks large homolog 5 isoform X2 n=1 Tax=Macrobrachium rosenbergii TaxID=79674 RepID=UPI0034D66724